jgi:hypothetical protein
MGGLLVATILTLLVVPALYALWFRVTKDEPAGAGRSNHPEVADGAVKHARMAA